MTARDVPAKSASATAGAPQVAAPGAAVDVGRILDDGAWSSYQKFVLALVSLVIVLDGLDTQTLSLAIPTIVRDWGISRAPFGIVLALGYVAMAIGTGGGGWIGDRFGRRVALLASMVVFGAGTLAGALANDVAMLGVTRMVAMAGLGAAMPNATAMAAEYTPRRFRSMALGIALGSVPIGGFLGGLLAASVLPSWRALFVVCGVIPLVGAALLAVTLPESIRFLLGRDGAAPRITVLLGRIGVAADRRDRFVDGSESHVAQAGVRQLFGDRHRRDTIVLAAAFFLIIFANLFVISWAPSLLADLHYPPSVTSTAFAMWSIGGLFGAVGGAALFARIGSRAAMAVMGSGAVAITAVLALTALGPGGIGVDRLLLLMAIGGCFIPGSQVLLFALAGQVFPTTIRGTGTGFTAAVGRIGAVAGALAGPFLLATGSRGFFAAAAAAMLASGLILRWMKSEVAASRRVTRPHP